MPKSAKKRAKELAKELERELGPAAGPVPDAASDAPPAEALPAVEHAIQPPDEAATLDSVEGAPDAPAKRGKKGRKAKASDKIVETDPEPARASKPERGERPRPQRDARPMALDLPPADLSDAMRGYLAKCDEKIGFIPNVLVAYTHDDAKLAAFAAFYNDLMLAPSGLSKLEREMIAVAVSAQNRCYYCLAAHGAAVRQLSGDPALGELLVMNYRAADLAPRHRAMLDFAVKLTDASHSIAESDREALRAAGFGERDIWDIGAVASFYNMTNRMASAVDMRPNPEYHAQAR